MANPDAFHEYPLIARLIDRMKRLSARLGEISELRRMDERQIDQLAHEFGLSRTELFSLCANDARDDLLKKRLAQFGLSEELLAKKQPDVLRDLQRVCATCSTTLRCAHDFAVQRDTGGDEYCPNTCTLNALRQEGLARSGDKNDSSCCGSCSP